MLRRSFHDRGSASEIEADAWAYRILAESRKDDPMELLADIATNASYQFLTMMRRDGKGFSGERLSALEEPVIRALDMALKKGDLAPEVRDVLIQVRQRTSAARTR